ncbi:DUF4232 domain-containing protein [Bacillus sp. NP157]|nr:DUF4232 domain-containing protein [Bacillus sp. NP157]
MPVFTPVVAPCTAGMLSLATDGRDGDLDGMSHGGSYLVVTNKAGKACTVPGLPMVSLKDAQGAVLPAARKAPVGMHPGPAVVPVRLEPGASAQASLRWVSGEVFDKSRCVDPARVEVRFGDQVLRADLAGHLCGEDGKPIDFEQSTLTSVR